MKCRLTLEVAVHDIVVDVHVEGQFFAWYNLAFSIFIYLLSYKYIIIHNLEQRKMPRVKFSD